VLGYLLKKVQTFAQIATLHRDLGIAYQGEIAQTLACNGEQPFKVIQL
jgi:hypothetical protein